MALKKPLVITNGQIEQLQSGDRIDLSRSVSKTAGVALVKGTPVYVTGGNANKAQADSQSTVRVAGLVAETVNASAPVEIQTEGIMVATTAEWDAVTNQSGGLTEGSTYYLDAVTAGKMTVNAPATNGDFVVVVGHALSATEFEIEVGAPIKL